MTCQQALKAPIKVLKDNKEETNMSSKVRNPATQVFSSAALMSVSKAGGSFL